MTDYLTVADTAKLVRQALKAAFPGVKFSVRSNSYAGGASIDVSWTDGPLESAVQETAKRYEGATFDGMTDMKSNHSTLLAGPDGNVAEVSMGADYVFTRRDLSESYRAELAELAARVIERSSDHYAMGWGLEINYYSLPTPYRVLDVANGHQVIRHLSQHVAPGEARALAV